VIVDPTLPIQNAFILALKASVPVAALVSGRVYDWPPPRPVRPYITVGEIQVLPDKADCFDSVEMSIPIHGWSQTASSVEVKQLGRAIIATLDAAELAVEGHHLVLLELEQAQYLRDPDGITHHAVVILRALTEPSGVTGFGSLVAQG
jgi:hypothetical protein